MFLFVCLFLFLFLFSQRQTLSFVRFYRFGVYDVNSDIKRKILLVDMDIKDHYMCICKTLLYIISMRVAATLLVRCMLQKQPGWIRVGSQARQQKIRFNLTIIIIKKKTLNESDEQI